MKQMPILNRSGHIAGRVCAAVFCVGAFVQPAGAEEFLAELDEAEWRLQASALECRLSQPIPSFGEAVFRQRAGESVHFELASHRDVRAGQASLRIVAPEWQRSGVTMSLGDVPVASGRTAVRLDSTLTEKLMSALREGLSPVFGGMPSDSLQGLATVVLTPVNFRRAYADYTSCRAGLIPATLAEVARTRVSFDTGKWELDDTARGRLELVARHVVAEASITAVYVDGYTDDTGRRAANLELSRRRAEAVSRFLEAQGVAADLITTRYHGSRYPVASGRSTTARAQNRRVTVRLERG